MTIAGFEAMTIQDAIVLGGNSDLCGTFLE